MTSYQYRWENRKKELIVVNILIAIILIVVNIKFKTAEYWIGWWEYAWILGGFVSAVRATRGMDEGLGSTLLSTFSLGCFTFSEIGENWRTLALFGAVIGMIKLFLWACVWGTIALFKVVIFPFETIYLFIRSR